MIARPDPDHATLPRPPPHLAHTRCGGGQPHYVQARAGHSQGSITERYMHAAQVLFPGTAEKSEARMFGDPPDGGYTARLRH